MPSLSRIDVIDQLGRKRTLLVLIVPGLLAALASIALSAVFLFLFLPLVAISVAMLIRGGLQWYAYRNPPKPRKPRAKKAKLDRLPWAPAKQIPLTSTHCLICSRALTNPQSMRARVGSTCIKTHGPRYANVPNPAYAEWQELRAAAESKQAAEQVRLDAQHQVDLVEYNLLLLNWEREIVTPEGLSRSANRRKAIELSSIGAATTVTLVALSALSIYAV